MCFTDNWVSNTKVSNLRLLSPPMILSCELPSGDVSKTSELDWTNSWEFDDADGYCLRCSSSPSDFVQSTPCTHVRKYTKPVFCRSNTTRRLQRLHVCRACTTSTTETIQLKSYVCSDFVCLLSPLVLRPKSQMWIAETNGMCCFVYVRVLSVNRLL